MDEAVWGFVGVILGGIITGLTTLGVETVRSRREAALDSAKRQDDRRLGRDQFQRDTLLALQDAVIALGRASSMAFMHDKREFETTAVWRPSVDEDLRAAEREARLRLVNLKTRVADEATRKGVDAFIAATFEGLDASDPSAARTANQAVSDLSFKVIEMAGELIRKTFPP